MAQAVLLLGTSSRQAYEAALEGLVRLDVLYLRSHPNTPGIYGSGVRFKRERAETWKRIPDVIAAGGGDCEDLAAWRAAELRVQGIPAVVIVEKIAPGKFHAIVGTDEGVEDPSRKLGMGKGQK